MKKFLSERPLVGFLIISIAATLVSTWLLNPSAGPIGAVSAVLTGLGPLKVTAAVLIMTAGAGASYVAARLASDPTALGLVPVGAGYSPGRRLTISAGNTSAKTAERTADDALDDLE